MTPLDWLLLIIGGILATIFNYYLNLAPGAITEEQDIAKNEILMNCNCCISTLVIPMIVVAVLAALSSYFATRTELYIISAVSFSSILTGGLIGRRKRIRELKEMIELLEQVIPQESHSKDRVPSGDFYWEDNDS